MDHTTFHTLATTHPIHLNVGCGTHIAPAPWWNIDVTRLDDVQPDEVIPRGVALSTLYGQASCARVYLGHVLEHVPWRDVRTFMKDVKSALIPGGEVCVVGPDVRRVLDRWHRGLEPEWLVHAVLEGDPHNDQFGEWPEVRHSWNCHEERVVNVLEHVGFIDITPLPVTEEALAAWPTVGHSEWQFAITARITL